MIEILIEHSQKENYHVIESVSFSDVSEKEEERLSKILQREGLKDSFFERPKEDETLQQIFADLFEVPVDEIIIDTFEIDGVAEEE